MKLAVAIALAALMGGAAAQSRDAKKSKCESYERQLERNTESARKGGDAKKMERLNEERRKINAARSKAGC